MEFKIYKNLEELDLDIEEITRTIKEIHIHHTWEPSYNEFYEGLKTKSSETVCKSLCDSMMKYHVSLKWGDIAQNFTTFPDGTIALCRNLNTKPVSIIGRNEGSIAIENVGNFDKGKDKLTDEQYNSLIALVNLLLTNLKLPINEKSIVYHNEYSDKTCPGTAFPSKNNIIKTLKEYNIN